MKRQTLKALLVTGCLLVSGAFGATAWAADASLPPDKVVESVAKQVLADLDANREMYRKDSSKLRQLIDKYLLANFDSEYAAKLVLAKNWRTATPEQRKQFIDAFYQSLLQNYGNSVLEFTADRLKILPYQGKPDDTTATVRSEIRRDNGSKVPVNYTLHKTDAGWKAYDITIEGVSYVKSFRTDFGTEIDQKGLDAVIKRLQTQQGPVSATTQKKGSK
ncbi:MAG: ABC transporter substrate-binding protein [Steroidobacteraceae bacterium]